MQDISPQYHCLAGRLGEGAAAAARSEERQNGIFSQSTSGNTTSGNGRTQTSWYGGRVSAGFRALERQHRPGCWERAREKGRGRWLQRPMQEGKRSHRRHISALGQLPGLPNSSSTHAPQAPSLGRDRAAAAAGFISVKDGMGKFTERATPSPISICK
ncbi:hypothetical protein chiPu_0011361 [Chiloscyllium punctatum]|uniref:Uncharacterized protein n=1 Tax=Chiloscyllium punctatum TaxID=137246 RepID=A0A401SR84_CHIPU|nr:hypothetical protein [Chiloscyllium punctatum]